MKAICIKYLQEYVAAFQERRSKTTDEVVNLFMSKRPLQWRGNPRAERVVPVAGKPEEEREGAAAAGGADGKMTKNQLKKLAKEKQIAEKKAAKTREKEAIQLGVGAVAAAQVGDP